MDPCTAAGSPGFNIGKEIVYKDAIRTGTEVFLLFLETYIDNYVF